LELGCAPADEVVGVLADEGSAGVPGEGDPEECRSECRMYLDDSLAISCWISVCHVTNVSAVCSCVHGEIKEAIGAFGKASGCG
jgi:hypothetical protein